MAPSLGISAPTTPCARLFATPRAHSHLVHALSTFPLSYTIDRFGPTRQNSRGRVSSRITLSPGADTNRLSPKDASLTEPHPTSRISAFENLPLQLQKNLKPAERTFYANSSKNLDPRQVTLIQAVRAIDVSNPKALQAYEALKTAMARRLDVPPDSLEAGYLNTSDGQKIRTLKTATLRMVSDRFFENGLVTETPITLKISFPKFYADHIEGKYDQAWEIGRGAQLEPGTFLRDCALAMSIALQEVLAYAPNRSAIDLNSKVFIFHASNAAHSRLYRGKPYFARSLGKPDPKKEDEILILTLAEIIERCPPSREFDSLIELKSALDRSGVKNHDELSLFRAINKLIRSQMVAFSPAGLSLATPALLQEVTQKPTPLFIETLTQVLGQSPSDVTADLWHRLILKRIANESSLETKRIFDASGPTTSARAFNLGSLLEILEQISSVANQKQTLGHLLLATFHEIDQRIPAQSRADLKQVTISVHGQNLAAITKFFESLGIPTSIFIYRDRANNLMEIQEIRFDMLGLLEFAEANPEAYNELTVEHFDVDMLRASRQPLNF